MSAPLVASANFSPSISAYRRACCTAFSDRHDAAVLGVLCDRRLSGFCVFCVDRRVEFSALGHRRIENSLSGGREYPRSMAATSRSIVSRSAIASRGNGDSSSTSTVLRYPAQVLQTSTRRSFRSSSGAAVTNASPLSPQYTHAYVLSSHAAAQNEQRSRRWPPTTSASAGHDPQARQ